MRVWQQKWKHSTGYVSQSLPDDEAKTLADRRYLATEEHTTPGHHLNRAHGPPAQGGLAQHSSGVCLANGFKTLTVGLEVGVADAGSRAAVDHRGVRVEDELHVVAKAKRGEIGADALLSRRGDAL